MGAITDPNELVTTLRCTLTPSEVACLDRYKAWTQVIELHNNFKSSQALALKSTKDFISFLSRTKSACSLRPASDTAGHCDSCE